MINACEKQTMTGAQIFIESLKKEGVDRIFGYPGGVILGIYEALYNTPEITHYLVRHEQAALHAAEGFSRTSGKCGVALVTSGPGATNTVTGIANAYLDGYPMVVFTGQVSSNLIGNDAFQEADTVGITRACCKHNYLVKDVRLLAKTIKEAFHIATTGKQGPVLIDLAKNVLDDSTEFIYPEEVKLQGYKPTYQGNKKQISQALQILCRAKRPVIISGGGVLASNASKELTELALTLEIPVANTLMGIGTFSNEYDLSLGMLGMHGNYWANFAVNDCDVLLAVGTRFNDRITGSLKKFAQDAKVIHVDIDPCSISKNVRADIPIVGDAKIVLQDMIDEYKEKRYDFNKTFKELWFQVINEWKTKRAIPEIRSEKLHAHTVLETIHEQTKHLKPIIATEVGQHQMWSAQAFKFQEPRKLLTSGGLGTMGFGFPAAMGACVAQKDHPVILIAGDGSIQMNIQELATCVEYGFPVKVFVMNNGYLGMIRQWQEKLFDRHYSQSKISAPDFVKLAEAYGAKGLRVEKQEDLAETINQALAHDGPVFVDCVIESMEMVYPWVLAGKPIDNVLLSDEN